MAQFEIGERIEFGAYPQDANGGKRPIQWRVLQRYGQVALLVSEHALDGQPMHQKENADDGEECMQFTPNADGSGTGTMRMSEETRRALSKTYAQSWINAWLNHDFMQEAFTERERTLLVDAKDCDYPNETDVGKVFLLSVRDINDEKMFPSDLSTGCCATAWAKSRYSDHIEIERQENATMPYAERASWWLRDKTRVVYGGCEGRVGIGCMVFDPFSPLAVRPAILIDTDKWGKADSGKLFSGLLGMFKKKDGDVAAKRSDVVTKSCASWTLEKDGKAIGKIAQVEEATATKGALLVYTSMCGTTQGEIKLRTKPGIQKDHIQAMALCFGMACNGNAQMQMTMGALYWHGTDVPQSYEEAVRWSRYAANQGQPEAMLDLAECYNKGLGGLEKDDQRAFALVEAAAKKGLPAAMHNLAMAYHHGVGVEPDEEKAMYWMAEFEKSQEAANGNS